MGLSFAIRGLLPNLEAQTKRFEHFQACKLIQLPLSRPV